jgi:hypothetical protein
LQQLVPRPTAVDNPVSTKEVRVNQPTTNYNNNKIGDYILWQMEIHPQVA